MTERKRIATAAELAELAIFPLPDAVLFPGALLPLHIFEPRYRAMTADVLAGSRLLAVARLRPGFEADYQGRPPVHELCGVGEVVRDARHADGRYDIVLRGLSRVRIVEELPPLRSYRSVRAELVPDAARQEPSTLSAWQYQLELLWRKLSPHLPPKLRDLGALSGDDPDPGAVTDRLAAALLADPDDRQRLLEELDPSMRVAQLVEHARMLLAALGSQGASSLN
jgi:Lon protease-like protein